MSDRHTDSEEEIFRELPAYLEEEALRLSAIDAASRESDPHYLDKPQRAISFSLKKPHPIRRGVLIAAALLILASAVPVVAVNWEQITAFFFKREETHTAVGNRPIGEEPAPYSRKDLFTVAWLPEGYHSESITFESSYIEMVYTDDAENKVVLMQSNVSFRANLNSEDGTVEEIKINGADGVIVEVDGAVKIAWSAKPQFLLCGRLPREDMIRIAESVQPSPEIQEKEEVSK